MMSLGYVMLTSILAIITVLQNCDAFGLFSTLTQEGRTIDGLLKLFENIDTAYELYKKGFLNTNELSYDYSSNEYFKDKDYKDDLHDTAKFFDVTAEFDVSLNTMYGILIIKYLSLSYAAHFMNCYIFYRQSNEQLANKCKEIANYMAWLGASNNQNFFLGMKHILSQKYQIAEKALSNLSTAFEKFTSEIYSEMITNENYESSDLVSAEDKHNELWRNLFKKIETEMNAMNTHFVDMLFRFDNKPLNEIHAVTVQRFTPQYTESVMLWDYVPKLLSQSIKPKKKSKDLKNSLIEVLRNIELQRSQWRHDLGVEQILERGSRLEHIFTTLLPTVERSIYTPLYFAYLPDTILSKNDAVAYTVKTYIWPETEGRSSRGKDFSKSEEFTSSFKEKLERASLTEQFSWSQIGSSSVKISEEYSRDSEKPIHSFESIEEEK